MHIDLEFLHSLSNLLMTNYNYYYVYLLSRGQITDKPSVAEFKLSVYQNYMSVHKLLITNKILYLLIIIQAILFIKIYNKEKQKVEIAIAIKIIFYKFISEELIIKKKYILKEKKFSNS